MADKDMDFRFFEHTIVDEDEPNANKYTATAQLWKYPQDVGESPEQPHSIIFHINVRERSSAGLSTKKSLKGIDDLLGGFGDYNNSLNEKTERATNENRSGAESQESLKLMTKVGAGIGGLGLFRSLARMAGVSGLVQDIAGGIGAVGGFIASEDIAERIIQANETVDLQASIQLHIPTAPNVSYGAKWNNTSVGAVGGLLLKGGVQLPEINFDTPGAALEAAKGIMSGNSSTANAVARAVIQAGANLPSQLGGTQLGDVLDIGTKTTLNPFREQLFEQMDFRTFGFTYTFAPKNEAELTDVMNIIQLFKYHMHPELTDGSTVMIYPSEFDIEYMYKTGKNQYINQISSCALTGLDVSYGGADFTTFKGTDGAPSQITMALKFTELEMLVRKEGGITQDWRNSK